MATRKKAIELGDEVREVITGFSGMVTGRTVWLNGCARLAVQPRALDKDGKMVDAVWFDEPQLVLVKRGAYQADAKRDTGGPRDDRASARKDLSR